MLSKLVCHLVGFPETMNPMDVACVLVNFMNILDQRGHKDGGVGTRSLIVLQRFESRNRLQFESPIILSKLKVSFNNFSYKYL